MLLCLLNARGDRVAKCEELFWALPVPEGKGPLILPADNVTRTGALLRLQSA